MKSKNIDYLIGIDHVRAIAAILITLYHGTHIINWSLLQGTLATNGPWPRVGDPFSSFIIEGHGAVSLFLVLSGFIFTIGAYGKDIIYWEFMRNRFLRIYPLFLALIIIGIYINPASFSWNGLFSTLFFANLGQSLPLGPISFMFFTIAIEFHFYFIFPFLLRFLNQPDGNREFLALFAIALLFRLLTPALGGSVENISYFSIVGRIDQFLMGMLAAKLWLRHDLRSLHPAFALLGLGLALLASFVYHQTGGSPFVTGMWRAVWPTLEALVYAVFIITLINLNRILPARLSRTLAGIGIVSFSMYLLHYTVIYVVITQGWIYPFAAAPLANAFLNTLLFILPTVIAVSSLTYFGIERPFLGLRRRYVRTPDQAGESVRA